MERIQLHIETKFVNIKKYKLHISFFYEWLIDSLAHPHLLIHIKRLLYYWKFSFLQSTFKVGLLII